MLYYGVLILLLLQFLRPQEFLEAILGWRLLLAAMLILLPPWLATLGNRKLLRTPEDLLMFLLWAMGCISLWNYSKAQIPSTAFEFGRILLIYLFVAHVTDTRQKLLGAVATIVVMLLVVARTAGQDAGLQGQYASFIAMFDNRNDFANAVAIMIPIAVAIVLKASSFFRLIGAAAGLFGLYKIFLSDSRGGQFAALFGGAAVFYLLARSKVGKVIMLALGAAAVLAVLTYSARLQTATDYRSDESAMARVEVWKQALTMFRIHPLIGFGYGKFADTAFGSRDAHSTYMLLIAELGGIGLFIYLGLLYFALRNLIEVARNGPHPTLRLVAIGLAGALVGHTVGSLFMTRVYHPFVMILFAIASALRLVADRERQAQIELAGADPASAELEPPGLWARSFGPGFYTKHMISRKDLWRIGGLTFACWLLYKVFVMRS